MGMINEQQKIIISMVFDTDSVWYWQCKNTLWENNVKSKKLWLKALWLVK